MRIPLILLASVAVSLLAASASRAADIVYGEPSPAYAPLAAQSGDWTGGHVGVFGGAAAGDFEYGEDGGAGVEVRDSVSAGGLLAGAQAGYDIEVSDVVIGAAADIALTDIEADLRTTTDYGGVEAIASASSRLKYLGTVRGRAGYGGDRLMAYGHGGLAYGKTELELSETQRVGGIRQTLAEEDRSGTRFGYAVGAGLEVRATDHVSVQTEYGYHDLGEDEIHRRDGVRVEEDVSFHAVKAGLNFRF